MPRSTNPIDYQHVPRPVAAMAKVFPDGHVIAAHSHPRGQLIHAVSGVMTVEAAERAWLLPPGHALWMPPRIEHRLAMSGRVSMKTVYIADNASARFPASPVVVGVSPLLRELILRATELPVMYDETGTAGRVMQLVLDELAAMRPLALSLPLPRDRRLQRLSTRLRRDPGVDATISEHAREIGMSERTLARLFRAEVGMTFGQWQRQLRLLEATRRLASGVPVTTIALDLGYAGPSAFTAMFRRALGLSPRSYRAALAQRPATERAAGA